MLPVVEVGDDFLDHRTRERAAVVGFAGLPLGVDRREHRVARVVSREVGDHAADVIAVAVADFVVGVLGRTGLGRYGVEGRVAENPAPVPSVPTLSRSLRTSRSVRSEQTLSTRVWV